MTTAPRKPFPIKPAHPERICWGCDRYCPAHSLLCGNGSLATPHPSELFGDDWLTWGPADPGVAADASPQAEAPGAAPATGSG